VPAYTNDGGHLNAVGATYGAAGFVESIATALRSRSGSQGPQAGQ
jgi:hypothetical protein